ncbi:MAG TPA: class I SAM-dependent methyltransferase [Baekduia sp.]|uniref:class I SAM-dependent methyltransferase n=1 Tax=Baekduia sp. TaxID=2600305 RepID=UPI002C633A34|nr:class I SAM-dependent methyltransferase [Baekduia sp.]HMJ36430.1 class I SAM-dependent methyltransferase [Baekduia sp.]
MSEDAQPSGFRFLREAQQTGEWPWFDEHYREAPQQIVDFLAGDGLSLEGKHVADIGCGDGIIDLGLYELARPASLTGFDLEETDTAALLADARRAGVAGEGLPAGLRFRANAGTTLPADDASFDALVSWSTFEHVAEPVALLREMRRVLKPDGLLFLQIWPLYYSQHGSHLWPWYPDGYAQLLHDDDEIARHITEAEAEAGREADVAFIVDEFRHLNRITADGLQRAMLAAGLYITKFELLTGATRITRSLARRPLSELGVAGIKLVAVPGDPG